MTSDATTAGRVVDVVVIGRANVDITLRIPARPDRGQMVLSSDLAYRRDTALALADKSAAQAAAGEPEIAAETALTALPIAGHVGSHRIIGRLTAVATSLRPHHRLEPVARLIHELAAT